MTGPDGANGGDARPTVSVVLPVYNGSATVADTIASVLRQTLTDFELIVIDDGSTDRTPSIVGRISDRRIRYFSFENKGLPASRNRGIRRARADFVAFIDADDLWTTDKLEMQWARLAEVPEAGMVYSWSDMIDEHDYLLNYGSHARAEGHVYTELLQSNFLDNGSNPMARKAILERVGLFDETFTAAEDWEMWLRIAHEFQIVCVPRVQIYYRVHRAAMSSSIKRQEFECLRVFSAALARLDDSSKKESVRRNGERNLYRYFTARVAQTATGSGRTGLALHYLRKFWNATPSRVRDFPQAFILLLKILVMGILPAGASRRLLGGIGRLRGRYGKIDVARAET